jgi:hypothetical protein
MCLNDLGDQACDGDKIANVVGNGWIYRHRLLVGMMNKNTRKSAHFLALLVNGVGSIEEDIPCIQLGDGFHLLKDYQFAAIQGGTALLFQTLPDVFYRFL